MRVLLESNEGSLVENLRFLRICGVVGRLDVSCHIGEYQYIGYFVQALLALAGSRQYTA